MGESSYPLELWSKKLIGPFLQGNLPDVKLVTHNALTNYW